MVNWLAPILVMLTVAAGEWLHARRTARVAHLAFGRRGAPHRWTLAAAPLRVVACGALTWGLLTLVDLDTAPWQALADDNRTPPHHIVLVLDVSPSMHIGDSGPNGQQPRGDRARDVLQSVLARTSQQRGRVSVVAFYTSARPVVVDTRDPEVVDNILRDLPLEHAFSPGKTDMFSGVACAAELAQKWPADSATLVVVSDGDSLPSHKPPELPPAFKNVLVLGVGNPLRGTYIHDHNSKQDRDSLKRLALRLGGTYYDATEHHVASSGLVSLATTTAAAPGPFSLRELAILAVLVGAIALAALPPLLAASGGAFDIRRARSTQMADEQLVNDRRVLVP